MAKRDDAVRIVLRHLGEKFGLPASYFREDQQLKRDWYFQRNDYIALMVSLNNDQSNPALIIPSEILPKKTIGEVIDLVFKKLK